MPLLITGHRGAMALEPENTMRSFLRAQRDGAGQIELDLHASADGAIVVIHDRTVDRTTNGSGLVNDLTLAEIARLDAGGGERVPTFEQVLDGVDLAIQVEVKDPLVVAPLVALVRDQPGLADRLVLSSFQVPVLTALAEQLPSSTRGLIVHEWQPEHLRTAVEVGCVHIYPGKTGLSAAAVAEAADEGVQVTTWLVDDEVALDAALAWGVAGVSTNDPGRLVDLLGQR